MSDMKCPFCQQELGRKNINDIMCSNEKCVSWKRNFYGSEDLWQELIRTREVLGDTIKLAEKMLEDIEDEGMCSWHYREKLNKITALEQKDKQCGGN